MLVPRFHAFRRLDIYRIAFAGPGGKSRFIEASVYGENHHRCLTFKVTRKRESGTGRTCSDGVGDTGTGDTGTDWTIAGLKAAQA